MAKDHSFNSKKSRALGILRAKGIKGDWLSPLPHRLLWKAGLTFIPPCFARFSSNVLIFGLFYSLLWGVVMWFMFWQRQEMGIVVAVLTALLAGALFGLFMALLYRWYRKRHALPHWHQL